MAYIHDIKPIATNLLTEYGLPNWTVSYDLTRNTWFGSCNSSSRTIKLNPQMCVANTLDRCVRTLKHEIAHAVVGSSNGHSEAWQEQMISMQLDPTPCFQFALGDTQRPPQLYRAVCTCGRVYELSKLKTRVRYTCSRCHSFITFERRDKERKMLLAASKLGLDISEDNSDIGF